MELRGSHLGNLDVGRFLSKKPPFAFRLGQSKFSISFDESWKNGLVTNSDYLIWTRELKFTIKINLRLTNILNRQISKLGVIGVVDEFTG